MNEAPISLVNDVIISGSGFALCVTIGTLDAASTFITQLYDLRSQRSDQPFPLVDDDSHLAGFVIPAKIESIVIQSRCTNQLDLSRATFNMLEAQTAFYKSHTPKQSDF